MGAIKTRPAVVSNAIAIASLYAEVDHSNNYLSNVITRVEKYPFAITFNDDACLGFIYSSRFAPDILDQIIYVAPHARNRGVGSVLLRLFKRSASRDNYAAIILFK